MRAEVNSAVEFLSGLLGKSQLNLDSNKMNVFSQSLHTIMCRHYQNHWFPEKPFKGSAYRCMRIVNKKMDPLINEAGAQCGLTSADLLSNLPSELTMWVDPDEVSYRFGEEGSIGVIYDAAESDSGSSDSGSSTQGSQEFPESPVRSANCSPAPAASPPVLMYPDTSYLQQSPEQQHHQQQQFHQYHPHPQQMQMQDNLFQQGCKNEWLRGYFPSGSQENLMQNIEYLSSAFVSS